MRRETLSTGQYCAPNIEVITLRLRGCITTTSRVSGSSEDFALDGAEQFTFEDGEW